MELTKQDFKNLLDNLGVIYDEKTTWFSEKFTETKQTLQLLQPNVSGWLPITRDELINALNDKRITTISNLHPDIYYLSKKETADHLLNVYLIQKRQ